MNPAVVGIDIVDRKVENGVLKTHRLITTEWGLPSWATRILGADRACFAAEQSEVDPRGRVMTLMSRNVSIKQPQSRKYDVDFDTLDNYEVVTECL